MSAGNAGMQCDLSPFSFQKLIVNKKDPDDVVDGSDVGITVQPRKAFTACLATNRLLTDSHQVNEGEEVRFETTGTLPTGLIAGSPYFAIDACAGSFRVAKEPFGVPVKFTSVGSGTHAFWVVGEFFVSLQDEDVAAAGDFWLRVVLSRSGKTHHLFPELTLRLLDL